MECLTSNYSVGSGIDEAGVRAFISHLSFKGSNSIKQFDNNEIKKAFFF